MTTLNGLVGIDFNLAAIVASTSLSSQRAVLIHQFDDGHGVVQPAPNRAEQHQDSIVTAFGPPGPPSLPLPH